MQEANQALSVLEEDVSIWGREATSQIAAAIETMIGKLAPPTRQALQDYCALPCYFPDSMWVTLCNAALNDGTRLQHIGEFAKKLGLRNCSETTFQFLTSLMLHLPGCSFDDSTPRGLHEAFLFVKQHFRAALATELQDPEDIPFVEKLPVYLGYMFFLDR